jgi:outer membrane protein OmpA-like peptidoglycan-associated protein
MNTKKSLCGAVAALVFAFVGTIPAAAQPASEFDVLQKTDKTVSITEYKGSAAQVTVPAEIYGMAVNEIASSAFSDNKTLQSVTIPASVVTIESAAFALCSNLKSVNFEEGLRSIGDSAFAECALDTVSLPQSLVSIGNSAFQYNKLTYVLIPDAVLRIGVNAFADNPSLTRIALGAALQDIYADAFGAGEYALNAIGVKKAGLPLGGIGFDQNFVNVYSGADGGAGVYLKQGSVWIKDTTPLDVYTASLRPVSVPAGAAVRQPVAPATPAPATTAATTTVAATTTAAAPATTAAPVTTAVTSTTPAVPEDPLGQVWIIYFAPNGASFSGLSSRVNAANNEALAGVVAVLEKYPTYRVRVTGYANEVISSPREERELQELSEERAEAAAAMLGFFGISERRIVTRGRAGANPIAGRSNRNDWYRNRRAEFTIIR